MAQFADCDKFTPPAGTEGLCETTTPEQRTAKHGTTYYIYSFDSPAAKVFGGNLETLRDTPEIDHLLNEWSQRAIRAEPLEFAELAWRYLLGYYLPGSEDRGFGRAATYDFTADEQDLEYRKGIEGSLERYYNDFDSNPYNPGLKLVRAFDPARLGTIPLWATTILTVVGLAIGTRRSRSAVFLFGVGGLSLLAPAVLTGVLTGRYMVPMAGLMMAAAGVTLAELWRLWKRRGQPRAEAEPGADRVAVAG